MSDSNSATQLGHDLFNVFTKKIEIFDHKDSLGKRAFYKYISRAKWIMSRTLQLLTN